MKTLLLTAAALTLVGCASMPGGNTGAPPQGFEASATEFTGWVRVVGEEFRLYDTEVRAQQGGQGCVSGALPRDLQRASRDLSGQQVRYIGHTLAWTERSGGQTHDWRGSNIANSCRKDVVILAERVEVIR